MAYSSQKPAVEPSERGGANSLWLAEWLSDVVEDRVFAVQADARARPFATGFFDAILCIDSFSYFATDDRYLAYIARFAKRMASSRWLAPACCRRSTARYRHTWRRGGILGRSDDRRANRERSDEYTPPPLPRGE